MKELENLEMVPVHIFVMCYSCILNRDRSYWQPFNWSVVSLRNKMTSLDCCVFIILAISKGD